MSLLYQSLVILYTVHITPLKEPKTVVLKDSWSLGLNMFYSEEKDWARHTTRQCPLQLISYTGRLLGTGLVVLNPKVDRPPFTATVASTVPLPHYQVDPVHQPWGLTVHNTDTKQVNL